MKTLLLLFLPVLASWCSGQETPNPEKGEQLQEKEIQAPPLANKVNNDSTPFRFLSYAERKTLSPLYHYFGGMTLKRTVWPVYEYRDSALDLLSNGMWVTVTGSEPLLGLKLNVNSLINVPHHSQTEGGRIWNFFITPSQIPPLLTGQARIDKKLLHDYRQNHS